MSEAQTNANRENAKKSTGPRTDAGKTNSSRNAIKHGFTSTSSILPGEDPEVFQVLRDDHYTRFQPVGPAEEMLVDRIVSAQCRLDRAFPHEAAILRDNFFNIRIIDHYRGRRYETRKAEAIEDGKPIPERPEIPGPEDLAGRAYAMDCKGPNAIAKLTRHETALERSIDRSIKQLAAFQAARFAAQPVQPVAKPVSTPVETTDCKTNPIPRPAAASNPLSQPMQPNATPNPPSETDFKPVPPPNRVP